MRAEIVPTAALIEQVEAHMGKQAVEWKRPECGQTEAQRFVVKFADGSGVFAKAAVDELTERWLRVDHLIMSTVEEDFVPQILGWLEPEGNHPILLIEDLSGAHWPADHWPVEWRPGQMEILLAALERLAAVRGHESLPAASGASANWRAIEADATGFLALGLCSESWLAAALPVLLAAEAGLEVAGTALVHDDVRSDNLCFIGERIVLVDWSQAFRGHPDHDRAEVLPGLVLEGGPEPYEQMPEGGGWAARGSAAMAQRALTEAGDRPEWLIEVFMRLAAINLRWAARCLDLPLPDGTNWRAI